jgi:hypothetical protein
MLVRSTGDQMIELLNRDRIDLKEEWIIGYHSDPKKFLRLEDPCDGDFSIICSRLNELDYQLNENDYIKARAPLPNCIVVGVEDFKFIPNLGNWTHLFNISYFDRVLKQKTHMIKCFMTHVGAIHYLVIVVNAIDNPISDEYWKYSTSEIIYNYLDEQYL